MTCSNFWVDTNLNSVCDCGYWEIQAMTVFSGCWEIQSVSAFLGFWKIQSIPVFSGYWEIQSMPVFSGCWEIQSMPMFSGYLGKPVLLPLWIPLPRLHHPHRLRFSDLCGHGLLSALWRGTVCCAV